jgi:hypothetical protein
MLKNFASTFTGRRNLISEVFKNVSYKLNLLNVDVELIDVVQIIIRHRILLYMSLSFVVLLKSGGTRLRSWLRHYATSRKVAGSSPDEVDFFNLPNPSSRIMALGSTRPLREMSTRHLPGVKDYQHIMLTTLPPSVNRLYRKCVSVDVSQLYGRPRPITGIALAYLYLTSNIKFFKTFPQLLLFPWAVYSSQLGNRI